MEKQSDAKNKVIRIDNEVRAKLEEKAKEYGMVFQTPNDVLRKLLGLNPKEAPKRKARVGRPRTA